MTSAWTSKGVVSRAKTNLEESAKAWYQTEVLIPKSWEGKSTEINLTKVSTDAIALSYIAGSKAAFTAKDHHFKANQLVEKQAFFFNDTREVQICNWNYVVNLNGKTIAKEEGRLSIPVGDKKSQRINFYTPQDLNIFKTEGTIVLNARIGNMAHVDTFHFRVFKDEPIDGNKVINIFDPVGKSTDMLLALGYTVIPCKEETNIPFLIIGRDALSKQYAIPFSIPEFVEQGGKFLVLNQQEYAVEKKGLRISKYVSRNVFPIKTILSLCNWMNWIYGPGIL